MHSFESAVAFLFIAAVGIIYGFCRYANKLTKAAKEKDAITPEYNHLPFFMEVYRENILSYVARVYYGIEH